MTLKEIKAELLSYTDFFGGDIPDIQEIRGAKNKQELASVIDKHSNFLDDMLSDAQSHLKDLKERTGLNNI